MLTGSFLFEGQHVFHLFHKIKRCSIRETLNLASADVTDLLLQLLNVNPASRISATCALNHPWLKHEHSQYGIIEELKKIVDQSFFQFISKYTN